MREARQDTLSLWGSVKNTSNEGFGKILQHFSTKPSQYKGRDRFVLLLSSWRNEQVSTGAQLTRE
jgi:hypothetical protein